MVRAASKTEMGTTGRTRPLYRKSLRFNANPDEKLGFGYTMNQMQMGLGSGSHGFALIAAVHECLG